MADVVKIENKTVQEKSLVLANLIKMKQGKRRDKNVEEVEKPRGFDRGLEMDCILGAANLGKTPLTLQFLVRWIGCDELDLISGPEMNEKAPERVIKYYEELSPINAKFEKKEKERLAMALRPVIVSKVEHMMQNENVSNEELFRAAVEEATEIQVPAVQQEEIVQQDPSMMVQIPQEYNTNMPMMDQEMDMNWSTQDQMIPQ